MRKRRGRRRLRRSAIAKDANEPGCYLVNTDKRYREELQQFMFKERCIAACRRSKNQINSIQAGATVFLYENHVGIVAAGIASGKVRREADRGQDDERHSMTLDPFHVLRVPISAAEVRSIQWEQARKDIFFARTVQPLDERTASRIESMAMGARGDA